jgi:competence protein ComEC
LHAAGVQQLDLVVATHPHADHIGGMSRVLDAFPVKLFLDSGQSYSTKTYTNMLKKIRQKNIQFLAAHAGQEFELDAGIKLHVLSPIKPFITDSQGSVHNANSIVIRLVYGSFSMLFTGDSEQETERRLVAENTDLSANILKVAHHGSKYSTTIAFLKVVQPEVAVISCGSDNEYGHPAQRTLDRIKPIVRALHRTDLEGTITIYTDGTSYRIETERPAPGDLWVGRTPQRDDGNSDPVRMMGSRMR